MLKKIILVLGLFFSTSQANQIAVFETTSGTIELELREDLAPKTVENFVKLINNKYYDGIIFHRVIKHFMIQTGDPTGTGAGGESIWGKDFADELHPKAMFNRVGVLAMANKGPNTNGSQFFITTTQTPWLNGKHSIFGYVANKASYSVVQKIENLETTYGDKPKLEQKIIKAYMKK
jgi:peptidylprolyl isomerase